MSAGHGREPDAGSIADGADRFRGIAAWGALLSVLLAVPAAIGARRLPSREATAFELLVLPSLVHGLAAASHLTLAQRLQADRHGAVLEGGDALQTLMSVRVEAEGHARTVAGLVGMAGAVLFRSHRDRLTAPSVQPAHASPGALGCVRGDPLDSDGHGSQQYAPLTDIEIPRPHCRGRSEVPTA